MCIIHRSLHVLDKAQGNFHRRLWIKHVMSSISDVHKKRLELTRKSCTAGDEVGAEAETTESLGCISSSFLSLGAVTGGLLVLVRDKPY